MAEGYRMDTFGNRRSRRRSAAGGGVRKVNVAEDRKHRTWDWSKARDRRLRADGLGAVATGTAGVRLVRNPNAALESIGVSDLDTWLEANTILTAYEAIACLHIIRGDLLAPALGYGALTNRATAELLATGRLAVIGDNA